MLTLHTSASTGSRGEGPACRKRREVPLWIDYPSFIRHSLRPNQETIKSPHQLEAKGISTRRAHWPCRTGCQNTWRTDAWVSLGSGPISGVEPVTILGARSRECTDERTPVTIPAPVEYYRPEMPLGNEHIRLNKQMQAQFILKGRCCPMCMPEPWTQPGSMPSGPQSYLVSISGSQIEVKTMKKTSWQMGKGTSLTATLDFWSTLCVGPRV